MLAGWLFADLFLVLFIVAFSSQPTTPVPSPTPTRTPTPTSSPTPTPTPKPVPVGLDQNPLNFVVNVSPVDVDNPATRAAALTRLLNGLKAQLASQHLDGTAGFVVIFATSVTSNSDPVDEAVKVANSVLPVLRQQDGSVFGRAGGEGFWGGAAGNYFHFQIFFFTK